ncbi:MAG: hypothetical protein RLZZ210_485 [Pseudomonadota bacterium]|jgi:predicted transposase/invertase (TIGR01784 family)
MLIANPIYDSAFKFLMKSKDMAKHFLSVLLDREIEIESFDATEDTFINTSNITGFSTQRMDFSATITEPNGKKRKVLIELQKSHTDTDISRFRRYLASAYYDKDNVIKNNEHKEIISIYILGFSLKTPVAVVRTSTQLIDATTGEQLNANTDDETFIRKLHHESIFIDTSKLDKKLNTRIDKLLSIFNQKYTDKNLNNFTLSIPVEKMDSEDVALVLPLAEHLNKALMDEPTRSHLMAQEEFNLALERNIQKEKMEAVAEAVKKAEEDAKQKEKLEMAKALQVEGMPIEMIMRITKLSREEIES